MKACRAHGYAFRHHGIRSLLRFGYPLGSRKARFIAFSSTLLLLIGFASRHMPIQAVETTLLNSLRGTGDKIPSSVNRADWHDGENFRIRPRPTSITTAVLSIQDIVLLPDHILLIIRLPELLNDKRKPFLTHRDHLTCLFDNAISTPLTGVDYSRGRVLIRCRPPGGLNTTEKNFGSRSSYVTEPESPHVSPKTLPHTFDVRISLIADGNRTEVHDVAAAGEAPMHVKTWQYLVFEMWATETDMVVFAKGVNKRQGRNVRADELVCVFGDGEDAMQTLETNVSESSQEVFRCGHPPLEHRRRLIGKAITLRWGGRMLPTVAYYEEFSISELLPAGAEGHISALLGSIGAATSSPREQVCACNMIYNVAKLLPEWSTFHSHVGIDRFIFYDNNSEDDLDAALGWMADRQMRVFRYPWPWPKTQEAGFSHCVLATWQACEWVLFADVDEFLFPAAYLPPSGRATALTELIRDAEGRGDEGRRADEGLQTVNGEDLLDFPSRAQPAERRQTVGQISFKCRDFGPSNLTRHPARGVTQGYVCREKQELRHKSLVRTAAVSADLLNVVHHFNLLPGYTTLTESPSRAVVNHYKYQAWTEFRQKFRRRVSAYVSDWKENRNLESRDRTPGLGASDLKPPDWESAFCETIDTALRDYCIQTFAVNSSSTHPLLLWQQLT